MEFAAKQHSVFTTWQAIDLGVDASWIRRRVRSGILLPVHHGVLTFASAVPTWRQRVMAAALACGPEAFASHRSAAAVWGLIDDVDVAEVTVPYPARRRASGVIVYRSRRLEAMNRSGFRVAAPMRTILDLAAVLRVQMLERMLDTFHRRGLVELGRLAGYLERPEHRSLRGSGELRRMVAARDPNAAIDSDLESLFFADLRRLRLPLPQPQVHVVIADGSDRYIDFAYPERRIAIELDSLTEHGSPRAFVADRVRQNEIEALGWHFFRFTWAQVTSGSFAYLVVLADALGLEPCRWRARKGPQRFIAGHSTR